MASKRPRKLILNALSDLKKIELEEFCSTLLDRREEPRVHRNAIEGKSIIEITEKLVSTFTEDGAIEITLRILKEIDCNNAAKDLEQAVNNLKDQLKSDLKALQDNRNKYKEVEQKYSDVVQLNKKQVVTAEKQIRAEIEKMHQFLREEEKTRLAALREEEEQKGETLTREMKKIQENLASLSDSISAVEQELQKPSGSFPRVQCKLSEPQLVSGVLLDVAKHLGNLTYRVWEKMKEKVKFTPVILDPNTAHPCLCLSEDLTSVRFRTTRQQLPDNPERFTRYPIVLGSEGFSSGKHSWEIEVGDHPNWVIGLALESVDRKGEGLDTPEYLVWVLCHRGGTYSYVFPNTLPLKRNPQRIRVQLDYDRGEVSFYDPEDMTHIYTHKDTFTEKVYPYFTIAGPAETIDIKVCQVETSLSVMLQ